MKIYFAGSIRGGRGNAENNAKIIEHIRKFGEVLTEHVGNVNLTSDGEALSERRIYDRDMEWISGADAVVADVSLPSLGVGYEIREAEKLDKPVLCLYKIQEGKKLSAMIEGSPHLKIFKYRNIEEALNYVDKFFAEL